MNELTNAQGGFMETLAEAVKLLKKAKEELLEKDMLLEWEMSIKYFDYEKVLSMCPKKETT